MFGAFQTPPKAAHNETQFLITHNAPQALITEEGGRQMDSPLTTLKGVGAARMKALEAAELRTVRDLIEYLPAGYRDLNDVRPLALLSAGEEAAVRVRVAGGVNVYFASKKLTVIRVKVQDESGKMTAVWYNQP